MERATTRLKPDGLFSYIVSKGWLRLNSFQNLRELVLDNFRVLKLIEMRYRVFQKAAVDTCLFVLRKDQSADRLRTSIEVLEGHMRDHGPTFELVRRIPQRTFLSTFQKVFDLSITKETERVKRKMRVGHSIANEFNVCFGLKTGHDETFLHHSKGLHAEDKPLLRGDNVKRYGYDYKGEYVWYVPAEMRRRHKTARPGEPWRFEQPKVLVKDTTTDFACTYDDEHYYVKDVLIIVPHKGAPSPLDLRFVAGIVNSSALRFFYRTTFKTLHVQAEELGSLPLPKLDLSKATDFRRHKQMVKLVDKIIDTRRQLSQAKTDRERDYYQNKYTGIDRKIDDLAYLLYGLKQKDIVIVKRELDALEQHPIPLDEDENEDE